MKLHLPHGYDRHRGWNWTLCRMLAQSGLFEIATRRFSHVRAPGARSRNFTLMQLNRVLIGLDTWDTYSPTSVYLRRGFFDSGGPLAELDLVIKIQFYDCPFWGEFENRTGIPVRPWTVMPSAHFSLEPFAWKPGPHGFMATSEGRNNRFGRQRWVDWCVRQADFHAQSDYVTRSDMTTYVEILSQCRWGLVLKGKPRNHDGKNRRECEFTSCGLPLVLNYRPTYPFAMTAGEHYVFVKTPDDLASLRDIDPVPFAEASRQLYDDHFSAPGLARTLIALVESL